MARKKSGAHPEKALSPTFCRQTKAPGKHLDGNGLYLVVDPSGAKRWLQRIVIRGKRKEIGLGSFSLVPLAEAREVALQNRALARSGGDPLAERRRTRAVLSFAEAARHVHAENLPTWRNAKHGAQFMSTLEAYAFPRIGHLSVAEISGADVLEVLRPIWLARPETARRVKQRVGKVLQWARVKGWRADDPTTGIELGLPRQSERKGQRKALSYHELPACLEAIEASGAAVTTKAALRFLVLTAARSGEVRLARWSEIDLGRAEWVVPAYRMKANREHRVPLAPEAVNVLRSLGPGEADDLIFPGSKQGRPMSDMTMSKLVKELGFDADVHGFRTSFRTWAQERTNAPREVAEAALAHVLPNKVEAAYARSDLIDKRRKLMERWARFAGAPSGQVVAIA